MIDGLALTTPGSAISRSAPRASVVALVLAAIAASCTSNSATITAPSPVKCAPTLTLASSTMAASGGTGVLSIATTADCTWTASSQDAWLSGFSPSSGQGSAQVEFSVAANSLPAVREGDVVVNEQRARVRQEPAPCLIEIAPAALDVSASGEAVSATVTAPTGCTWTATTDVSWITVTSSGSGNGTLSLTVAANSGGQRSGTVRVGDQALIITQATATCSYSLAPTVQSIGAPGGAGSPVSVVTSVGCGWTAVSNAPWITVTAGQSGSGNGAVSFTVAANAGDTRTGTLTIAGHTLTVTQVGVTSCAYSVNPSSQTVGASGGVAPAIGVATAATCAWTAQSNAPWITLLSGAVGTGNGPVTYEVAANIGSARAGTLTIAGQTVTVSQSGASGDQAKYTSGTQASIVMPLQN
jgi:hypothetical protein